MGARTPGLEDLTGDDPDGRMADRSETDDPNRSVDHEDEDDGDVDDRPNYLVRRGVVVGAAIAAIAVASFGILQFVGGDDGDDSTDLPSADWNSLVVLTDEEVRVVDPDDGDVVDTFAAPGDALESQSVVIGDVLVTMTDAGRIVQTDLGDGTATRSRAGRDETLRRSVDDPTVVVVGADEGGDITIVDTGTGETSSMAAVAGLDDPLIFPAGVRISPSGSHAAMSDARSFQSVVVDLDAGTAEPLAGQVVAIGDDSVVTAQRRGDVSELEFWGLDGERLGSVDVPTPVASMLTDDGSMLVVDANGDVARATSTGDVEELDALVDPDAPSADVEIATGAEAFGDTRLVVGGGSRVFVLDGNGEQIAAFDGNVTSTPTRATRCVAVGSERSSGGSVLVDLSDASVVAEIPGGVVSLTSLDGCTAVVSEDRDPQVVADGEVTDVDADSVVAVAPDGTSFLVRDGRDTELVPIDGDDAIEIADEPSAVGFADR